MVNPVLLSTLLVVVLSTASGAAYDYISDDTTIPDPCPGSDPCPEPNDHVADIATSFAAGAATGIAVSAAVDATEDTLRNAIIDIVKEIIIETLTNTATNVIEDSVKNIVIDTVKETIENSPPDISDDDLIDTIKNNIENALAEASVIEPNYTEIGIEDEIIFEDNVPISIDEPSENDWLEITYISFNHPGDSTLIEFPNGKTILIDGGKSFNDPVTILKSVLTQKNIETIDLMLLSHGDFDHVGGLKKLLDDSYWKDNVSEVWVSAHAHHTSKTYIDFFKNIRDEGTPISQRTPIPQQNVTIPLPPQLDLTLSEFEADGMSIEILNPPFEGIVPGVSADKKNSNSLIAKITYGEISILFAADATWTTEKWLSENKKSEIDVDITNAPHHGSQYASGWDANGAYVPTFIEDVDPKVVIYSVNPSENQSDDPDERTIDEGNKEYGHPSIDAQNRWSAFNSDIKQLRTSWEGHITIRTDGVECFIQSDLRDEPCW